MPSTPQQIDTWKSRLLDLSRRNRLLHLRPGAALALTNPPAADLYGLLVRRRALEFADALTPEQRLEALSWDAPATGATVRLDRIAAPAPAPGQLATDRPPAEQERALYNLRLRARTIAGEQGVNVLYVAIGFLEWLAPGAGETFWRSPLLLLPVELRRPSLGAHYSLRLADDEVALNPTLAHKLRQQFGLALPELPADPDELEIAALFEQIEALIAGREGWQLARDSALGLFSFLKLLMYTDLERAAEAAAQHPIVARLAGDAAPLPQPAGATPGPQFALDARPPEHCYQVLDADSSQAEAIEAARAGASFVLQGPPGTGKSQTIANIIAESLAAGRRVLFVSEKMAALRVVYDRLDACGLGEFCLELHSHKAGKRAVLDALGATLAATPPPADPAFPYTELAAARDQLNLYAEALHTPDPLLGWTPFSAHGRLGLLHDAPDLDAPLGDLESYTPARMGAIDALLTRLDARADLLALMPGNVWRGCAITTSSFEERGRIRARLRALLAALAEPQPPAEALAATLGMPAPRSLADMRALLALAVLLREPRAAPAEWLAEPAGARQRCDLIAEAGRRFRELAALEARLLARYDEGLLALDLPALRERFATQHAAWSRVLRPQFHRDIAALRAHALPGADVAPEAATADLALAIELRAAREWLAAQHSALARLGPAFDGAATDWDALAADADWAARLLALPLRQPLPAPLAELAADRAARAATLAGAAPLAAALTRLDGELAFVNELGLANPLLAPARIEHAPLAELQSQCALLLERMGDLDTWWEYCELRRAAEPLGLAGILDALSHDSAAAAQPRRAFYKRFCQLWLDRAYDQMPVLRRFGREGHAALVERFRRLDREQLPAAQARLRRMLAGRRPALNAVAEPGSELATLRRELQKQRRHKPIRQLFREIPQLLGQLKPCLLMSPLSVSQFLDPEVAPFDLVIFDEASQIRTEDAIGAIMRGRALIVVGDNRQLPPTNFFAAEAEPDPDDDDAADAELFESVLDAASAAGLPTRLLRWHYRSRDEALITFSNRQFYSARLATFPNAAAAPGRGVSFVHVPDGVYDRQASRTNAAEARRVADLAIERWRATPERSLGVVTFSQPQQLAVLHELERRRAADESLAPLLDESRPEPFFVKNLENVQGDERDVMIISVGYGPDAAGRVLMNFGPLNQLGGERRLNVAITRARDCVVVVSSLLPEAIDTRRVQNPGPRLLREYLDYARRGGPGGGVGAEVRAPHAEPAARPLAQSLEPRFEDRLAVALARRGLMLARQIGHSEFRIDIAVRDAQHPEQFVLGIECDGDDYRTAPTARDRERLREQMLGGLGWRIHRAWSAAWAADPAAEIERALAALDPSSR